MIYTGVDGNKTFSVDFNLLKKSWSVSGKQGKKIYAVPSHLCLVRKEKTDIKDLYDLKRFLSIEVEEKFGEVLWDVKLFSDMYCLSLIRDFEPPQDAFSYEPEVFSLARLGKVLELEEGCVLDVGRRKTTLVKLSSGEFEWFRVTTKGVDSILEELSRSNNLSPEESQRLLYTEGLGNGDVKGFFERIIRSLGYDLSREKVILSGGGSRLRGLEGLVGEIVHNPYVEPEMCVAFGASLKFLYKDCSPDFREEELSDRELRRVFVLLGASLLLFLGANFTLGEVGRAVTKQVRAMEREAFKREFPDLPTVAVRDQVKSMLKIGGYEMTTKLIQLSSRLKEGVEIYRFEFREGKLKVVGSTKDEKTATDLGATSIKRTPEGGYQFEVVID